MFHSIIYLFKLHSKFFNEPILEQVIQVISLILIFNALGIVQKTILSIKLDFKSHYKANLLASVVGIISIYAAFNNHGVWSIVYFHLTKSIISTITFWYFTKWKPSLNFSRESFMNYLTTDISYF